MIKFMFFLFLTTVIFSQYTDYVFIEGKERNNNKVSYSFQYGKNESYYTNFGIVFNFNKSEHYGFLSNFYYSWGYVFELEYVDLSSSLGPSFLFPIFNDDYDMGYDFALTSVSHIYFKVSDSIGIGAGSHLIFNQNVVSKDIRISFVIIR